MRAIVCGGRSYLDINTLFDVMDRLHATYKFTCIIEGGAKGADQLAQRWAHENAVATVRVAADWTRWGKRAGYLRNTEMLEKHSPDVVIAFPGGPGTMMMINLAFDACMSTIKVTPHGHMEYFFFDEYKKITDTLKERDHGNST